MKKQPSQLKKAVPHVLRVEDNPDVISYIRGYLDKDYRCIEAVNGEDGLKQARNRIPDLIISDIMMPKMDGVEFCKRIKTDVRTSHIPVILLTAKADIESKLEGLETGADDYLTKPFEAQELQIRIKNLLSQKQRLREYFEKELRIKPSKLAVNALDQQFLKQVIDVIEEYMSDVDFAVEKLAQATAMSSRTLNRKLQALTGHSSTQFLRSLRLKRAAQLLSWRSDSITQVAYQVGYNNPSYFSECFRRQFGLSPSEYVKQSVKD